VKSHLRYAVPKEAPAIRTARLTHGGTFRTKPGARWLPINGEQYFTLGRPGFVWDARVKLAPFLWIEARDRLLSGRGSMLVKLCSTFTIADSTGAQIDQGAALRWLAETVWLPYGFVGNSIRWEEIDQRSARMTLDAPEPVSAVVEIDDDGKFARIDAMRYRVVGGGKAVLTPWRGICSSYREFNGLRVPSAIEVLWRLEEGDFSYARFQVTSLEYNVR
jgi:hypothetical protein